MRIFDFLNVSNERSIWADSGFHVQRNVIQEILKKRDDIHFYLTVPFDQYPLVKPLESDRLTLLKYNYSSGSGHKFHFDTNQLWKLMDMWRRDYDLVICNEVILGNNFKNLFCYKSHFDIPIVNYVHWIDTSDDVTAQQWAMFSSIYWCYNTYCNSKYGKRLILDSATQVYNDDVFDEISKKLKILNVGFNDKELDEMKTTDKFDVPTLVFNHRISQYTGYETLLKKCQKIWDDGVKFQLIFTNPSVSLTRSALGKYPFLKMKEGGYSYKEYIELLWKSDICFGLHNGQNQWSIAFLEALYCDNIPITSNKIFYPEMLGQDTYTLDDLQYVIENMGGLASKNFDLEKYKWKNLAMQYLEMYEWNINEYAKTADKLKDVDKSKVLNDVKSLFAQRPIIGKDEILRLRAKESGSGMGCQTPYSKYRRELLKICDDVVEKDESMYRLKNMEKNPQKSVDWWI